MATGWAGDSISNPKKNFYAKENANTEKLLLQQMKFQREQMNRENAAARAAAALNGIRHTGPQRRLVPKTVTRGGRRRRRSTRRRR
jgi:hypothetical protein